MLETDSKVRTRGVETRRRGRIRSHERVDLWFRFVLQMEGTAVSIILDSVTDSQKYGITPTSLILLKQRAVRCVR